MQLFDYRPIPASSAPAEEAWGALEIYITERAKVDDETRRLTALFDEALQLPALAGFVVAVDCPLCGTQDALTVARIEHIRARVAETEVYRTAGAEASTALERLRAAARALSAGFDASRPAFLKLHSAQRREVEFTVPRIREVAGAGEGAALTEAWLAAIPSLARQAQRVAKSVADLTAALAAVDLATITESDFFKRKFDASSRAITDYSLAFDGYAVPALAPRDHLRIAIDAASNVQGWQEFLDLAADLPSLREALVERVAMATLSRELGQALGAIQKGNERVADDKFTALSAGIEEWWNRLRPEEPTFFSAVRPRLGARRTVDFKAGLAESEARAAPKFRDVTAIFSQSQLHCLGLSLFLARAVHEGATFMVLDEPVLSSGEDHRAFFNTAVVKHLLQLGVQVIILTQEEHAWKDLEHRYLHLGIGMFEMVMEGPIRGTTVTNTSDDLLVLLDRGRTLARNPNRDLRRQAGGVLRDAAERFCKEILVKQQRAAGVATASIADYDENLGQLSPKTEPLLVKDASHPGKLRTIGGRIEPGKSRRRRARHVGSQAGFGRPAPAHQGIPAVNLAGTDLAIKGG